MKNSNKKFQTLTIALALMAFISSSIGFADDLHPPRNPAMAAQTAEVDRLTRLLENLEERTDFKKKVAVIAQVLAVGILGFGAYTKRLGEARLAAQALRAKVAPQAGAPVNILGPIDERYVASPGTNRAGMILLGAGISQTAAAISYADIRDLRKRDIPEARQKLEEAKEKLQTAEAASALARSAK